MAVHHLTAARLETKERVPSTTAQKHVPMANINVELHEEDQSLTIAVHCGEDNAGKGTLDCKRRNVLRWVSQKYLD